MFPTEFLENKTHRKILRTLSEKNRRYTYEELAKICHRSVSTISRAFKRSNRYSFIEKMSLEGGKERVVGLNPDSRYTSSIKQFFETEREIERKNGTIPLTVWNLLEDYNHQLSKKSYFVELFLFGSHATGEYHSKSDIDLLLITWDEINKEKITKAKEKIRNRSRKKIQLIIKQLSKKLKQKSKERIYKEIQKKTPTNQKEPIIPLSGELKEGDL